MRRLGRTRRRRGFARHRFRRCGSARLGRARGRVCVWGLGRARERVGSGGSLRPRGKVRPSVGTAGRHLRFRAIGRPIGRALAGVASTSPTPTPAAPGALAAVRTGFAPGVPLAGSRRFTARRTVRTGRLIDPCAVHARRLGSGRIRAPESFIARLGAWPRLVARGVAPTRAIPSGSARSAVIVSPVAIAARIPAGVARAVAPGTLAPRAIATHVAIAVAVAVPETVAVAVGTAA